MLLQQRVQLRRSLKKLKTEGFRHIFVLDSVDEIESITAIKRKKLYNDRGTSAGILLSFLSRKYWSTKSSGFSNRMRF